MKANFKQSRQAVYNGGGHTNPKWDAPVRTALAGMNPTMAERMNNAIESQIEGAEDVTQRIRGTPRLVREGRAAREEDDQRVFYTGP